MKTSLRKQVAGLAGEPSKPLLAAGALAAFLVLVAAPRSSLGLLFAILVLMAATGRNAPRRTGLVIGALLLGIAVPAAGLRNSFLFELGTQVGIYAALAIGLNIVVGMAGLLDLGYAGFFAIGAYTWAIFGSPQANQFIPGGHFPLAGSPWFFLFAGIAVILAAIAGTLVGLPALRLRGDYLAIVTLGLGQAIRLVANNLDHPLNITNGPQGISPVERPSVDFLVAGLRRLGVQVEAGDVYPIFFYFIALLAACAAAAISTALDRSKFGRAWVAIREDEIAARSVGVPVMRAKMLAFATGAAFSGLMGAVFAAKQTFVSPESFTFLQSITVLVMVLLGGMGSIRGVVFGAAIVTVLNIEVLKNFSDFLSSLRQSGQVINLLFWQYDCSRLPTQLEPAKYERMVFGLIVILMMIFRPGGMIPEARHCMEMETGADSDGRNGNAQR